MTAGPGAWATRPDEWVAKWPAFLRRPQTWLWIAVFVLLAPQPFHQLTVRFDMTIDLHVYRDAGVSLLRHRPVYSYYTRTHANLLPFTYPPFAAVLALPLALLPLPVVSALWMIAVYAVIYWVLKLLLVPVRARLREQAPKAETWLMPVAFLIGAYSLVGREQIHFGQIGMFLMGLIVLDLLTPRTGRYRGVLVGVATAIKLTPGVFVVYLLLSGQRRAAAIAAASFAGITAAVALIAPGSSRAYWTSALFDSNRLGNNADPTNQSLRGLILRTPLHHLTATGAFLVLAVIVGVVGFYVANGFHRDGDELAAVTVVGLLMALLSPVAWVHHYVFMLALLVLFVRDGRFRIALAIGALWSFNWPGLAGGMAAKSGVESVVGHLIQDSLGLSMAAVVLWLPRYRRHGAEAREERLLAHSTLQDA